MPVTDVAFLTEAGEGRGLGHVMRCSAIAAAFEELGLNTRILVDSNLRGLVPRAELYPWKSHPDAFYGQSTLLVFDSYSISSAFCRSAAAHNPCVFLDDDARIVYPAGVIINAGIGASPGMYVPQAGQHLLIGPQYAPLRPCFWDVEVPVLRSPARTLLITMGGDDSQHASVAAVRAARVFGERVVVLASRTWPHLALIEQAAGENVEIVSDLQAEEILELFSRTDAAISAGGQTTYELARLGVPTLLVQTARNQQLNCTGWQAVGSLLAGTADENLEERLALLLPLLLEGRRRTEQSARLREQVDGQGARRAAAAALRWFEPK